ncbi:peptide MFS transporter [Acidomonas methanolica]|uniref:peptide MFS transporter n=1 Tax=Acidomonas methanolica TaxID=437 RepID=UPI002119E64B|nr:oligopeptide:H+ symporter [Acidomonas methanolica]MCQ9156136.1 MFS transporter [Acidomonas methanolica]
MSSPQTVPAAPSRRQSFTVVLAIELWERFGFYGMQAVLLLYLVQHLGMGDRDATLLVGAFSALTYISPVLGGLAGDRLLGARRCMVIGAVMLAAGYCVLGLLDGHRNLLIFAMALISTGNGLFKPNAGNMVRRIYEGDDAELDGAFTIYYMAVNVGSTVSMLLTPWLQNRFSPSVAFLTCAGGLFLGLGFYAVRRSWLHGVGGMLDRAAARPQASLIVATGAAGWLMAGFVVLGSATVARACIWIAALVIVLSWAWLYRKVGPAERIGLRIAYVLCAETMIFALFYQQEQTSLTLFALRAVDGTFRLGGVTLFHMSAGQFQALNPCWIMVASPVLAKLYDALGRRGADLSISRKIAIGFGLGAIGFLIWWLCAAGAHGLVSGWVMVIGYGFTAIAELLTMALGLAVITRYVPARLSGFMMGSLYLLWALSFYLGSVVANMVEVVPGTASGAGPYVPLLRGLFWALLGACFVIVALLPLLDRWERRHAAAVNLTGTN